MKQQRLSFLCGLHYSPLPTRHLTGRRFTDDTIWWRILGHRSMLSHTILIYGFECSLEYIVPYRIVYTECKLYKLGMDK